MLLFSASLRHSFYVFFSYVYTRIHAIFILGLFFLYVCAESPAGAQEGVACGNRTRNALTAVQQIPSNSGKVQMHSYLAKCLDFAKIQAWLTFMS
jgi:hypothetical protein